MKLFLLFSHELTPDQLSDARQNLGITELLRLPEELQIRWSNVPPDRQLDLSEYLQPVKDFILRSRPAPGDYALVQGDFGATYQMVNFCKQQGIIAVYATTQRTATEALQPDGSIVTQRVFKHETFRKY